MKQSILSLFSVLILGSTAFAQYPVVTIEQVQTVTQSALGNCDDQTFYLGDTVIIEAKVVMDGNLAVPSGVGNPNGHKNLWLQQGAGGPYKGINVFNLSGTSVTEDPHNLIAGDSVRITGLIDDYNGESQLMPLEGSSIEILGQNQSITPVVIDLGDLNDQDRNNKLETGEQWEGSYVEIHNAVVASVDFFSGGSRVSFNIEDQFGNLTNISDRFIVQKLPGEGGNFVAPNVGDQLDTLRGVVAHSKNNCAGFNGRGYEIYPFDEGDYVYGAAAPRIFNITRTPTQPSSSQDVTVDADITDNDGNIASATLYYATGATGGNFNNIPMSFVSGETYTADIPAQADGTLIRWYISATDDSGLVTTLPNSDPSINTYLYRVRDNGLTIFDLQFTPYSNGTSPYVDQTVSVEGVVTASLNTNGPGDLGYVYIQQENQLNYAGIWLQQGSTLSQLERGDRIEVEGTVTESFGMTALTDISSINVLGTGEIDPIVLNPDSFSIYNGSQEQFEGMLVTMENPTAGDRIYVVEQNADAVTSNNYGEYRIGTDQFNPSSGVRVLAGRSGGNSSLYVSYVNDSLWTSSSGSMAVEPYIVDYPHSMESMTGILYYSFGNMKLLPRNNDDIVGYGDAPVVAAFQYAADTFCVNDSVRFVNFSTLFTDEFEWSFGDGGTSTAKDPAHVYTAGGSYDVTLVARNSYDGNADTVTVSDAIFADTSESCITVGVREQARIESKVYPNPTPDMITIESGLEAGTIYSIHIIDVQGREVFRRVTRRTNETLYLNSLEPGNYFLEVRGNDQRTLDVMPIIKQ
jgi:PKD repeat protein/DNA/RNA endonuclease YhcR with UshA esterase domain